MKIKTFATLEVQTCIHWHQSFFSFSKYFFYFQWLRITTITMKILIKKMMKERENKHALQKHKPLWNLVQNHHWNRHIFPLEMHKALEPTPRYHPVHLNQPEKKNNTVTVTFHLNNNSFTYSYYIKINTEPFLRLINIIWFLSKPFLYFDLLLNKTIVIWVVTTR